MVAIVDTFNRYRRYLPAVCFLFGAVWDTLTLRRIDSIFDLSMQGTYLTLAGICVILIGRAPTWKFTKYLPNACQFFYGGLLSAFRVYYFKSAGSGPALVFMLVLAGLLVGNEFLEKKLNNAQVALFAFSLCVFMYLNFMLPVVLHLMNVWVFLAGVAIALGVSYSVKSFSGLPRARFWPTPVLYSVLVVLYLTNVIPPVPLAKKAMGIYHRVQRTGNDFVCTMEAPKIWEVFKTGENTFRYSPGDTVFCFTSVFAPAKLSKEVRHHWYFRNTAKHRWEERGNCGYALSGGREQGYRGFTYKKNIEPGKWKVVLKTDDGKGLGVAGFRVVQKDSGAGLVFKDVIQ